MKNIAVAVDDEIYRRARIKAAERDTSVSALVKGFLVELTSEEPGSRSLEREERELRARIRSFSAGNRLSRDDVHGRDRCRGHFRKMRFGGFNALSESVYRA
jgi:hypothetical protein